MEQETVKSIEKDKNEDMNIIEKLLTIQTELKVPKEQTNTFGNYKYRSCEDILEAIKPFCSRLGVAITISDEVVLVGERYYVRADATLIDAKTMASYSNTAYAREEEEKKGMDSSQLTGSTSSYARKYALNGLFALDDTKDSDSDEFTNITDKTKTTTISQDDKPKLISDAQRKRLFAIGHGNNEIIKRHIEKYGYQKTEEIKVSDYQKICDEIDEEMKF